MPERQIPWRRVAEKVAGVLSVETGLRNSSFEIVGRVAGMHLYIDGLSTPYTGVGDTTWLRLFPQESLRANINLYRNTGSVPLYQRFLRRDVVIGDLEFDKDWIINAKRESQAQAFLGMEQRSLLEAVPGALQQNRVLHGNEASYYQFGVRNSQVSARSSRFELDADRLMTVIEALVALAMRPTTLMQEYKELAVKLGGTLHNPGFFCLDGRVQVHFPAVGRVLSVSPMTVQTSWQRDTLRTRITSDQLTRSSSKRIELSRESNLDGLVSDPRLARQAMATADIVSATVASSHVMIDLEGKVTDVERLRAAGYLVASLCLGPTASSGPYR